MDGSGESQPHVMVVGAGIAGASVAAHLSWHGSPRVTVFDRGSPGSETTARSAAFFGFYGSRTARSMKRYGLATYNRLFALGGRFGPSPNHRYRLLGRLRVATSEEGESTLLDRAAGDEETTVLDPATVPEHLLVPELNLEAIRLAVYRPAVGVFEPRPLAEAFLDVARGEGASVRTGEAVVRLRLENGAVAGVETEHGTHYADRVVVAAGPWTPRLLADTRVNLPITHSLAPILVVRPDRPHTHDLPIVSHAASGVYARAHRNGRVLVGHHPGESTGAVIDPDEVPDRVPDERRRLMRDRLGRVLEYGARAPVDSEWVGVRSHTPDGEAISGETTIEGLYVVAFDSSGIQLAPATGNLVARDILGLPRPDYADAISPQRF